MSVDLPVSEQSPVLCGRKYSTQKASSPDAVFAELIAVIYKSPSRKTMRGLKAQGREPGSADTDAPPDMTYNVSRIKIRLGISPKIRRGHMSLRGENLSITMNHLHCGVSSGPEHRIRQREDRQFCRFPVCETEPMNIPALRSGTFRHSPAGSRPRV